VFFAESGQRHFSQKTRNSRLPAWLLEICTNWARIENQRFLHFRQIVRELRMPLAWKWIFIIEMCTT
jgi:hypothetical protein